MNVKGVKRAKDWDIEDMPEALAQVIDDLVDAMACDDFNLDCYMDELEGTARMVDEVDDRRRYDYYLRGGWKHDRVE